MTEEEIYNSGDIIRIYFTDGHWEEFEQGWVKRIVLIKHETNTY